MNKSRCNFFFVYLTFLFFIPFELLAHSGAEYLWTKTWGGENWEHKSVTAVDSNGNIYVVGAFSQASVDFNPGPGTDIHTSNGSNDCYLSKYKNDGTYEWTKTWGGISNDCEYGRFDLAIDKSDNALIVGNFAETVDFDPTILTDNHTSAGSFDMFLTRFNSLGEFLGASTWGGSGNDSAYTVTSNPSGGIYVTGRFQKTADFDPGTGVDNRTTGGDSYDVDIFISHFDASGNYLWVKTIGSSSYEEPAGLACDSLGNLYITGYFGGNIDFDPGVGTDYISTNGNDDIFLSKWDSTGNYLWTKTVGGDSEDNPLDLDIDSEDNIYIAGYHGSTVDFDPGAGEELLTAADRRNAFVLKLNSDASYAWAHSWGGVYDDDGDQATCVEVTDDGTVYVGGFFEAEVDFDPGSGSNIITSVAEKNGFLSIFEESGKYTGVTKTWLSDEDTLIWSIASHVNNTYLTGRFEGTFDFDTGSGEDLKTSVGSGDAFLTAYQPTYTLAGTVNLSGSPLSGVPIDGGALGTAQTDQNGQYELRGISLNESYTLTLAKYGYYFDPTSVSSSFYSGVMEDFTAYIDECPDDSDKVESGLCGCGVADTDSDNDGTADCKDLCLNDPNKIEPKICGCGEADLDENDNGIIDCLYNEELKKLIVDSVEQIKKLHPEKRSKKAKRKTNKAKKKLKKLAVQLVQDVNQNINLYAASVTEAKLKSYAKKARKVMKKAAKLLVSCAKDKKKAQKALTKLKKCL